MTRARRRPTLAARLLLPSGRRVTLRAQGAPAGLARAPGAPLFGEVDALVASGAVAVRDEAGHDVALDDLELPDFHVLRAALLASGHLAEAEVEVPCTNCGAPFACTPCAELELGPYVHGELGDDELDALVPAGEDVPFDPPLRLGRVREARSARLVRPTVRRARPLFRALGADGGAPLDAALVRAAGLEALGADRTPERVARALDAADDDAFDRVVDLLLGAWYPPRLTVRVACPACGARTPVDAPFERELLGDAPLLHGAAARARDGEAPFPDFDAFATRTEALAAPLVDAAPPGPSGDAVELVVVEGPADVDEGGEALLGSYVPPVEGGFGELAHPPRVSVYYRTFRALWDDEGPYDWEAEVLETVEHELEHHGYFLVGDDPMDEEERAEIARDRARVVGRRALAEREARAFGGSLADFARRAWPFFALLAAAALSWCGA